MPTKKTPIKDVLTELGLPQDAEFLGYVVHLQHSDEFLMQVSDSAHMNSILWSKIPDLVIIYGSY